jgi:hypothetical protein
MDPAPVTVEEIQDAEKRLISLPSSLEEQLSLLDEVEKLLIKVEQSSPEPLIKALKPIIEVLIGDQLLKNDEIDVQFSAASCISQILRITAPESPYGDEIMKMYFRLSVSSFEKLQSLSGRQYTKAVLILESFAKIRSCIIMLDLELDSEIEKMFRLFFVSVRSQLPTDVLFYMERTIITVLEESEELPGDLIKLLLNSLKKENKEAEPLAWELGTNVAKECVHILKKNMKEAVASMNIDLNDYADIVASICQEVEGNTTIAIEPKKVSELTSSVTEKDITSNGNEENASKGKESSEKVASTPEKVTSTPEKVTSTPEKVTSTSEVVATVCEVSPGKQNVDVDKISVEEHEKASGSTSSATAKNTAANGNEEDASKAKGKKGKLTTKSRKATSKSKRTTKKSGLKKIASKKRKNVSEIIDVGEEKSENIESESGKTTNKPKKMKNTSVEIDDNGEEVPIVAVVNEKNPVKNIVKAKSTTKTTKKKNNQSNVIDASEENSENMDANQEKESVVEVANEEKSESGTKTANKRKRQRIIIDDTEETKIESETQANQKKRSRKPNSLIKPDEGYLGISKTKRKPKKKDDADIPNESSSKKIIRRKPEKKASNLSEEKKGKGKYLRKEESIKNQEGDVPEEDDQVTPLVSKTKRNKGKNQQPSIAKGKQKIKSTESTQEVPKRGGLLKIFGEILVGHKIKVWWPEDSVFYPGEVTAFDAAVKKHQILYTDGEIEMLDLKKEKWEHVKEEEEMASALNTKSNAESESAMVEVKGYKVKSRIAPILEGIMSKHGDITSECVYQSDLIKASLLEIVCDTLKKLHNYSSTPDFDEVQSIIDDAEKAKFDIGWLRVELEKRKVSAENGSKTEVVEASKAAQLAYEREKAVLEEAQKNFEEAEKRHQGLLCVLKQLDDEMSANAAAKTKRRSKINPY